MSISMTHTVSFNILFHFGKITFSQHLCTAHTTFTHTFILLRVDDTFNSTISKTLSAYLLEEDKMALVTEGTCIKLSV
jgi:hypothetical protein